MSPIPGTLHTPLGAVVARSVACCPGACLAAGAAVPPGAAVVAAAATVVYTGRALTQQEETRLRKHAYALIIKDKESPGRLRDELSLFFHKVERSLPQVDTPELPTPKLETLDVAPKAETLDVAPKPETVLPPVEDPTVLPTRSPVTTDHRHPTPGIPPLEWLSALTSASKELFGESWEPRLAEFLAFLAQG